MIDANVTWHDDSGNPIACNEKIKILQENLAELSLVIKDAFEDGVLMGVSAKQLRQEFGKIVTNLDSDLSKSKT